MKKNYSIFCILFAFVLSLSIFSFFNIKSKAFAYDKSSSEIINSKSKASILVDANSDKILYSNNENERLPIASMCKIMTLLLCFEKENKGELSFDETLTVSNNASSMGGSQIFLEENGQYLVSDLIKGITIASANDACVAMAERIAGSEDAFVDLMNKKAEELKMENTLFANCTGLPKEVQYSCALDVSKMFIELIKYPKYFNYSTIWMDEIHHKNDRITAISNTNKLIRFYQGCDCGKTGYTSEAGHCLTASAVKNSLRLVSVVISAPDSKTRFNEVSTLFNYGFNNFQSKMILNSCTPFETSAKILGGKKESVLIIPESSFYQTLKIGENKDYEIIFNPNNNNVAPICVGDILGTIDIYENNVKIASINASAYESVDKMNYSDRIKQITDNWAIA